MFERPIQFRFVNSMSIDRRHIDGAVLAMEKFYKGLAQKTMNCGGWESQWNLVPWKHRVSAVLIPPER